MRKMDLLKIQNAELENALSEREEKFNQQGGYDQIEAAKKLIHCHPLDVLWGFLKLLARGHLLLDVIGKIVLLIISLIVLMSRILFLLCFSIFGDTFSFRFVYIVSLLP